MLLFQVGEERFAVETEYVVEVFPKVHLQKINHVENYVCGILNYGGTPIAVVDLCQLIGNRPSNNAMHTRIVLLQYTSIESGTSRLGAIAEQVTEVQELELSHFKTAGIKITTLPFIGGLYSETSSPLQLFKAEELFKFLKGVLLE
jgi:chemotaxis-related protein WspB